jgi:hypothetical protein
MARVTNNHNGILHIAGKDVRPGGSAEVDDRLFDSWKQGHAASIWLEKGIVSIGEAEEDEAEVEEDEGDTRSHREKLLDRAHELGLNPNSNTSNKKLEAMIAEAEGN